MELYRITCVDETLMYHTTVQRTGQVTPLICLLYITDAKDSNRGI